MATNSSDVICLVNCGPMGGKGPFSTVIYFENADLRAFSHGKTGSGSECELRTQEGGKPEFPLVDWEGEKERERKSPIWSMSVCNTIRGPLRAIPSCRC
jgi:hypothetical protein